jgi:hypothetical protein
MMLDTIPVMAIVVTIMVVILIVGKDDDGDGHI